MGMELMARYNLPAADRAGIARSADGSKYSWYIGMAHARRSPCRQQRPRLLETS
jgi:hypothetical protein